VSVVEHDSRIHVSVRDDGSGFDPDAATAGFGLAGMHERVELLHGELSIVSAPGEGTTVSATLPVVRRGPAEAHQPTSPSVASGD
jgi:signal transduction histidine kinase